MAEDEIKLSGILEKGYGLSPKLVMIDTNLSIEAKAIYAYLSSFCGNGITAFPSIDLIMHHLKISKNRFYKYRNELIDRGYIKVVRRREGQKAISNLYKLNLELPYFEDIHFEDIHFEDIQNEDTNNNSFINNNFINNKNKNISPNEIEIFFEAIWKAYPRKEGKASIKDKKKKELFDIGLDEMLRAINRYVKSKEGIEMKYIKQGSTFFNSGYVDYLDVNYEHDNVEEEKINSAPQKSNYEGRGY